MSRIKSHNTGSMDTFKKVLRFIGRYRFLLMISVILAAVSVLLQLYVPILFGNAIDEIVAKGQVDFGRMWYFLKKILFIVILSKRCVLDPEPDQQPYGLPHRTGYPLKSNTPYSGTSPFLSGQSRYRRHHQPGSCRCGYSLRRPSSWIYPAIFWNCHDYRNPYFYAFQKCDHHCSGDPADAS